MLKVDSRRLKPYGDRMDDGAVQLSFMFPLPASPELKEAAREYVEKMGFEKVNVAVMEQVGSVFTYFVVYGYSKAYVNLSKVKVPKLEYPHLNYHELTEFMEKHIKEPLVVIGATTGSDAHTVGIDAIFNMKGYAGDYGLERYPRFKAVNLRSQLSNEELVKKAMEYRADAILVSQIVTQRDSHIYNLKELRKVLDAHRHQLQPHVITIIGGPRISHHLAVKLGFDAGFGPGTLPSQVASFIVKKYIERKGLNVEMRLEKKEYEMQVGKSVYDEPAPVFGEPSTLQHGQISNGLVGDDATSGAWRRMSLEPEGRTLKRRCYRGTRIRLRRGRQNVN